MPQKFITKAASQKIKTSIQSSNFHLNGGLPHKNVELDKFLEERFNKNNIQKDFISKKASKKLAQHNFYRTDFSPEETYRNNNSLDIQMFSYPGSLMDLIFRDSKSSISQSDEESLYSLWKKSDDGNSNSINVDKDDIGKADKLMNRGYVIEEGGKYKLTEKGRRSLIGRILGSRPQYKWGISKTSGLQKFSDNYIIRGTDISLHDPFFTNEYAVVIADPQIVRKIQDHDLFSSSKVQWASPNLLAIPVDIIEEDAESNQPEYVSDGGQMFGQNSPDSKETWSNPPQEDRPVMANFSSSKVFGILKESHKVGCENVKRQCLSELESRGLNVRFFATNEIEREKGLMHSEPLSNNECAVFVFTTGDGHNFDHSAQYTKHHNLNSNPGFWNKNVSFPIDVGFYDGSGSLVSIKQLEANQIEPVFSNHNNIKYVVETPKDWYKNNGVKEGSTIWEIIEGGFPGL